MDSGVSTRTMEAPSSPSDRVFQFISDPRHKENLSGRVRAACITCRRKKIKCSGEINCRTCQEKGLVCEGLPERKRPTPKRDSVDSCILDPFHAGVDQLRKQSTDRKSHSKQQRPASLLRLAKATKSDDSGYRSISPTISEAALNTASGNSEESRAAARAAPAPFRVDIWDLGGDRTTAESLNDATETETLGPLQIPPIDPSAPTSKPETSSPTARRQYSQNEISWWNNNRRVDPGDLNLTSAAQILFGDSAQPPGIARPSRPTIDLDGMPFDNPPRPPAIPETASRRQTVQFPISSTGEFNALASQPGIFDDMALLLQARTPPMGPTPNLGEFSSWWDINTDISSILSQAREVLKDPESGNVAAQTPESPRPRQRPVVGNFYW